MPNFWICKEKVSVQVQAFKFKNRNVNIGFSYISVPSALLNCTYFCTGSMQVQTPSDQTLHREDIIRNLAVCIHHGCMFGNMQQFQVTDRRGLDFLGGRNPRNSTGEGWSGTQCGASTSPSMNPTFKLNVIIIIIFFSCIFIFSILGRDHINVMEIVASVVSFGERLVESESF